MDRDYHLQNILRELAERMDKRREYIEFTTALDEVNVRELSDDDLRGFADLCQNALLDANEEIRNRGL